MCYNDYASQSEATMAIQSKGFGVLDVEMKPVLGRRVQPVFVCESERDAETVQSAGFNARMRVPFVMD